MLLYFGHMVVKRKKAEPPDNWQQQESPQPKKKQGKETAASSSKAGTHSIACGRCAARPMPKASNWHEKVVVDETIFAVGPLCRSCWKVWKLHYSEDYTEETWCAACKDKTMKVAAAQKQQEMDEEDLKYLNAMSVVGSGSSWEVQQILVGLSVQQFEDRYGHAPDDIGAKIQVLPSMTEGKGFRGVLMKDPANPGTRYIQTRHDKVWNEKVKEDQVQASVANLSLSVGTDEARQSSMIACKFKGKPLTEAHIVEKLQQQGLDIPQCLLHVVPEATRDDADDDADDSQPLISNDDEVETVPMHTPQKQPLLKRGKSSSSLPDASSPGADCGKSKAPRSVVSRLSAKTKCSATEDTHFS